MRIITAPSSTAEALDKEGLRIEKRMGQGAGLRRGLDWKVRCPRWEEPALPHPQEPESELEPGTSTEAEGGTDLFRSALCPPIRASLSSLGTGFSSPTG